MVRPIVTNWTCPVAVEQLWELSGLDQMLPLLHPVMIELMHPVIICLSRELSGNNRTRQRCVRSWHCAVSGHHLTVEIGCSAFEERDDVVAIR